VPSPTQSAAGERQAEYSNDGWLFQHPLTEACGWSEPPRHVVRDRDGAYGEAFIRRFTAMGIRDRPISA
jgi:hypothetical protein